jgi:hypothetical protein
MIYNPKFLITNPENKDIQQNNNSKQRLETPEPQPAVATNHIVFKSQLILNDLVLYDTENNKQQCTPSPTSIKLVNKSDAASSINRIIIQQQHQQQHQSNELIDSSNDLSKSLSASSIQAQLENTIRLNSKLTNLESNTNQQQQQMPILIQQLPMMPNIVQTLVPILPTTATNDKIPFKNRIDMIRQAGETIIEIFNKINSNMPVNASEVDTTIQTAYENEILLIHYFFQKNLL